MDSPIVARGVRVHNLKGIDVTIPTRKLVVLTGISGSGKSTLAFDVLYAEGQRRYVESLSAYARQFLERLEKPDADAIEGLSPAVAIRQKPPARSPRSTVATATTVHDHLRALYAAAGETTCDTCGARVGRDSVASAVDRLLGLPAGTRIEVAFPRATDAPREEWVARLERRGFRRLWIAGEVRELSELGAAGGAPGPEVAVLVDRVFVQENVRERLADSLQMAFREGGGEAVAYVAGGEPFRFSESFACARCRKAFPEPEPRLFSFNDALGACPKCHGFGNLAELDLARVVPDASRSLAGGAIAPWDQTRHRAWRAGLRALARRHRIPFAAPWSRLSPEQQSLVVDGDGEFAGVRGFFRELAARRFRVEVRAFLKRYRVFEICPECQGRRLRPEARRVTIAGRSLGDLCALSVEEADRFLGGLRLEGERRQAAQPLVDAARRKLELLLELGLGYLTLDRASGTLSGGEGQRIALASALGSGLAGTLYVLDEPSVGLHPRDTARLLGVLKRLRDQGNTLVVVEHDPEVMRAADHLIDLGPGAGEQGGRVTFSGTYPELLADERSLTGKFLRGELTVAPRGPRRRPGGPWLLVRDARARNLKGIDVRIPVGGLTVVTGVSGSGKSTLVHEVLHRRLAAGRRAALGRLDGAELIERVEVVDQSALGRTPRSNPVTYMKAFDPIRHLFAATPDARRLGLDAGDFSFNVPGGRCEACAGDGRVRVDMHFLADVFLVCDDCGGRRYRPPVLEVRYRGRTIAEALEMTVRDALRFFAAERHVRARLKALDDIGLGYLRLGQPAPALSGGEAQRVKLASHLVGRPGRRVLYILDEPTTGLHLADVRDLLAGLGRLLEGGATVVVTEHHLEVVRQADWVIDLGPEGGEKGGHLVFQGTPESLAAGGTGATAESFRAAFHAPGARAAG